MKNRNTYSGEHLRELIFPLGGIGSGCVGIGGNGRLQDWEIFNRPSKGSLNGMSFLAVRAAKPDGTTVDARVLNGDHPKDYAGTYSRVSFGGYGYGVNRATMAGFPHFRTNTFTSRFPEAVLDFDDAHFPGRVTLSAWNPMIPGDEDASSMPAAFLEITFTNPGSGPLCYTAAFSLHNPAGKGSVDTEAHENGIARVTLSDTATAKDDPKWGELTMACPDGDGVTVQPYWYRGQWFDTAEILWREFAEGRLTHRVYDAPGSDDGAVLAQTVTLGPGESRSLRFVMAWYYPTQYNYWSPLKDEAGKDVTWRNYYGVLWSGADAVASDALARWDVMQERSRRFAALLEGTTLPEPLLEAAVDTLSVLKSPTVLRLEDGSLYGWEGVHEQAGSCEGTCTHVWSYAYALPYLFPRLERSLRENDFSCNQGPDGKMSFRMLLPKGRGQSGMRACADGTFCGLIKTWREWKLSGDGEWLKRWWPCAKRSLEYAWSESNPDRWDRDRDGVLEGRMHHTLDLEMFGPHAWLEGLYLAALKAAAEMAEAVGDPDAAEYRRLFASGYAGNDALFDPERGYYVQKIDLADRKVLDPYDDGAKAFYWNDEAGEMKYQIGEGCEIDQCLAQWHCDVVGLGDVFDAVHLDAALTSLWRNNHKDSMREFFNPCRVYALNDDSAVVMCDYPEGAYKPSVPITYCEEAMHGFEYALAGLLLSRGHTAEGVAAAKGVRDRYDGSNRNPFNEIECGNNYARSMAAFAFLPIMSGMVCDLPSGRFGFLPRACGSDGAFRSFWGTGTAWGSVTVTDDVFRVEIAEGSLTLKEIAAPERFAGRTVYADGRAVSGGFTARQTIELR